MKLNTLLLTVTGALFLIVDFLALHDVFEPHTLRDWLLFAASITFFIYVLRITVKKGK